MSYKTTISAYEIQRKYLEQKIGFSQIKNKIPILKIPKDLKTTDSNFFIQFEKHQVQQ